MNKQLKVMVHVAALVAVEVVLSRFCSISTQFGKIGFAFVPLAVCGMLFGPWWTALCGGLADFLGAILFPIGPYFPGFTLSNALVGLLFGICLRQRFSGWKHIALPVAANNLIVSLLISTYWLHLLYGSPYLGILPTRVVQCCVMIVLEFAVIRLIQKPIGLYARQVGLSKPA
jgi:ECF transporter S component (folate family)